MTIERCGPSRWPASRLRREQVLAPWGSRLENPDAALRNGFTEPRYAAAVTITLQEPGGSLALIV
jgi:hypothetical protein